MQSLLPIKISLFSDNSESPRLADRFVFARRSAHPGVRVVVRDLVRGPVAHLNAERQRCKTWPKPPGQDSARARETGLVTDNIATGLSNTYAFERWHMLASALIFG
jgi:FMN-dependent NADH-azoreductase